MQSTKLISLSAEKTEKKVLRGKNNWNFSPIHGEAADDAASRVAKGRDAAQDAQKSVCVGKYVSCDALVVSCPP